MFVARTARTTTLAARVTAAVLLGLLCLATPASAEEIITGPVDKATFQAIVDNADDGDTIVCLPGNYDFSAAGAVQLTKKVKIVAADEDNPPVFVGADDGSGGPLLGGGPFDGNTAFVVRGGTDLKGLTFEGLAFEKFDRAIVLYDGFDDQVAGCAAVAPGLEKVTIENNTIDNVRRGIQILGGPHKGLEIKGNVINTIGTFTGGIAGMLIVGFTGCVDPFSDFRFVDDTELLEGLDVSDNVVTAPFGIGIIVQRTKKAKLKDNTIVAGGTALGIVAASNGTETEPVDFGKAEGNVVSSTFDTGIVVQLQGDPLEMKGDIKKNTVQNSPFGVYFTQGVNGVKLDKTSFSGISDTHVYLDNGTFDNKITVVNGEVVVDLGTDNKIKFKKK